MSFASVVEALSPYSFYRCQDTSGTTLADSSGNSHSGLIVGPVTFSQPQLTFDGNIASSILVPTNPTQGYLSPESGSPGSANSAFTIGFLWKPNQVQTSYIAASGNSTGNTGWNIAMDGTYLYLSVNRNGFSASAYDARALYSVAGLSVGSKIMLWLTYNGSGDWNVYANDSSTPFLSATSLTLTPPSTPALSIGGYTSLPYSCGGYFSELMTFSSVLSQSNRASIYNSAIALSALVAPILSVTNDSTPSITWTPTSSGTPPYSYNLYRLPGPNSGISDVGSSLVYSGSGSSATDNPPVGRLVYYGVKAQDSSSTPKTVLSNYVPGESTPTVLLAAIGDSRTQGYNPTLGAIDPITQAVGLLEGMISGFKIQGLNRGIGGSTTQDWSSGTILASALGAISTAANSLISGSKVFVQLMLGVNDTKTAVRTSTSTYLANIRTIVNQIKAANIANLAGIILHESFYLDAGLIDGFDATSNNMVLQYNSGLNTIADGSMVFVGDTKSYVFFALNPGLLTDGLHPYTPGYAFLSSMWSYSIRNLFDKILNVVQPSTSGSPLGAARRSFVYSNGNSYKVGDLVYDPDYSLIISDLHYKSYIVSF